MSVMRLEELEREGCPKLESFLEETKLPWRRLVVRDFWNLKGLPHDLYNSSHALESLEIRDCQSLICFPFSNGGIGIPTTPGSEDYSL